MVERGGKSAWWRGGDGDRRGRKTDLLQLILLCLLVFAGFGCLSVELLRCELCEGISWCPAVSAEAFVAMAGW